MTDNPDCDFCRDSVLERGKVTVTDGDGTLTFCDWWCLRTWVQENQDLSSNTGWAR